MPLACFQCADKLLFAPKHAKSMPLRYDAIFIRAFGAPSIYPLSLCLIMTKN